MSVVVVRRLVAAWLAGCVAVVVLALAGAAVAGVLVQVDRVHRWTVAGLDVVVVGPDGAATVAEFGPGLWMVAILLGAGNAGLAVWRARRFG